METAPKTSAAPAAAINAARAAFAELGLAASEMQAGAELAQLVGEITEEPDIAVAAWITRARRTGLDFSAATATARFGAAPERLARRLEHLGDISLPVDWTASRGLNAQQAETLRKMLLAIAATLA